jgi:hypothetical protein
VARQGVGPCAMSISSREGRRVVLPIAASHGAHIELC